jgi:hypothetical protein
MKELLRKDFLENFRVGNPGYCEFCKLLDKTETLVESGTRRFKGTEAKANLGSPRVRLRFSFFAQTEERAQADQRVAVGIPVA